MSDYPVGAIEQSSLPGHGEALEFLKDAVNALEEGFILWDQDLKFVFCNDKYRELVLPPGHPGPKPGEHAVEFGYEIFKTGFWDIPDGADISSFADGIGDFIRSYGQGMEITRADGRVILASSNKTALGGYVLTFLDITDTKRADAAEQVRWDNLNEVVGSLEEGFSLWDADFKLLLCNEKYTEMVAPYRDTPFEIGYSGETCASDAFHSGMIDIPEGMAEDAFIQQWMTWARSHGDPVELTFKNGQTIYLSAKPTELGGVLITAVDVTEIKRSEAKRLEALTDVIGSLEEGFSLWDADFKLLLCNSKYMEMIAPFRDRPFEPGLSVEEVSSEIFQAGIMDLPDAMDEQTFHQQWKEWGQNHGEPVEVEYKDGRVVVVSVKHTELGSGLITTVDVTENKKAEKAQKQASELVQKVVEACPANFLMSRMETGEVLFRSAASKELFGEKPSARGHWKNTDDRERYLTTLIKDGRVDDMFVEGLRSDGSAFPSQVSARLVDYQGEKVIVSSTADLTEAFALRDERDKANAQLREAVEAIDGSLVLFDENDNLVVANAQHQKLFEPYRDAITRGTKLGDVRRRAVEDGYLRISNEPMGGLDAALASLKPNQSVNYEMSPANGSRWTARSVRLKSGGTVSTALDITEQLRAERLFADAIDHLPICIAVEGKDTNLTHCNDAYCDFYGLDWDNLKRLTFDERMAILYEKIALLDGEPFSGHPLETHRSTQHATEAKFKDGRHFIFERAPSDNGQTVIVITEITKLKMAEEKRLESITDAIQATDDAMVLFDRDVKFVLANRAWFETFWPYPDPPMPGTDGTEMFRHLIDDGFYVIPEGQTKESFLEIGMNAFFSFTKNIPLTLSDGRILMGSAHQTGLEGHLLSFKDITELRRAEERLLESVSDALQSLTDGIALYDANMEFVLGNKRYFEMWFADSIEKPYPGEPFKDVARRVIRSGKLDLPPGVSIDDMTAELERRVREYQQSYPAQANGSTYLASAHRTSLGGYLLEFADVTDQLRAEEELARQKEISHQNEKLSALGELLAGVAHELNNPLSVVFGYAQMLEGKVDDPKVAERLELIRQSAERAAKIVKTFLAMARQRPTKIELCSINDAVTTAIEVSSYSLTANGTQVVIDLDDMVPPVTGDFDQLAQVFTNLIVNAGHALEAQRDLGLLTLRSYYDADTDHTVVEVRDNGHGIPRDIQTRIFEPFFTTKDVGEGTGVGLAFSHRIVESHGGELELKSEPGAGTSFFIKLRSAKNVTQSELEADGADQPDCASVLVVDDEAGVAQLTHDLLTDEGFMVTQSVNPREALAILESQTFDVVLSDFKMPGMDGEQFYKALAVIAPECAERIGFITGDAMSANVKTFFEKSGRPHIEKPIMRDELLGLVLELCECTKGTK